MPPRVRAWRSHHERRLRRNKGRRRRGSNPSLKVTMRLAELSLQITDLRFLQELSERMMGLEPTTFCMASVGSVRALFAPVRARSLKVPVCRSSTQPTEQERTRTNHERDHCDHRPTRGRASTLSELRRRRRSVHRGGLEKRENCAAPNALCSGGVTDDRKRQPRRRFHRCSR